LFLQMDTTVSTSQELPVHIYESSIDLNSSLNEPQLQFTQTPYNVETGQAERISVDHIAKVTNMDAAQGSKRKIKFIIHIYTISNF
jgi:COP9 signalosome complex subunit 6